MKTIDLWQMCFTLFELHVQHAQSDKNVCSKLWATFINLNTFLQYYNIMHFYHFKIIYINHQEPILSNATHKSSVIHSKSSSAHVCWNCHLPGRSLLKCSGCKKARYCGDACYREDWERHREWCGRKGQRRKYAEMKDIENWERDELD